jgi:hypothetical protein
MTSVATVSRKRDSTPCRGALVPARECQSRTSCAETDLSSGPARGRARVRFPRARLQSPGEWSGDYSGSASKWTLFILAVPEALLLR